MILDKLLEKKDVLAYINFRQKELVEAREYAIKHTGLKQRESTLRKIEGRIAELKHFANVVHSGNVKKESIKISESLNTYNSSEEITTAGAGKNVAFKVIDVDECNCEYKEEKYSKADKCNMKTICEAFGIPYSELELD